MDRLAFQRNCVAATSGLVYNVGANEDPAGLKAFGERVINADLETNDSYLDGRPNRVDVLMDAREQWPWKAGSGELVVLGDIIEHLYPKEVQHAFAEARRVSDSLCITVPRDTRWIIDGVRVSDTGYRTHCHEWVEEELRALLDKTEWIVTEWHTVDYGFVREGYLILAD